MTRNARFELRLSTARLKLIRDFIVPVLTPAQRRQLLDKRDLMIAATSSEGSAGKDAVDLVCDMVRSGLPLFSRSD
jgi:hypothetical protein